MVDDVTFAYNDSTPRADVGIRGKYRRGDYARLMRGSQNEGLVFRIDHNGIRAFLTEVKYS